VPDNHKTTACLGCGAALAPPFLNLGRTPLANSYLRPEHAAANEPVFDLAVTYCGQCHLVQLTSTVPPESLFSEYLYFSSYSESYLAHASEMADSLISRLNLDSSSRVLEIASNDGYLLQFFKRRGIPVLGIEPAHNIAVQARERGIPTMECFFGTDSAAAIVARNSLADLIIGNNVMAHVPAINAFLSAVRTCLKPQGTAVFEFPYLGDLLDNNEFDTIYHEHVFYYSLGAVCALVRRARLKLVDVERQSVHGGSLRIFLQHESAGPPAPAVPAMLEEEKRRGLLGPELYRSFGKAVEDLKSELLRLLWELRASGKSVAAYGAPAKGNTLLNYCGVGRDLVQFTVDRSPHKQGLLLPGSRIPILAPQALLEKRPQYAVILPWNIASEIIEQQQQYLRAGGKFIIPIPHPVIVDG